MSGSQKISELDPLETLEDADGDIPSNPVQTGETVVVADGVATVTKTWRSKSEAELAADAVAVAQAALQLYKLKSDWEKALAVLGVTLEDAEIAAVKYTAPLPD